VPVGFLEQEELLNAAVDVLADVVPGWFVLVEYMYAVGESGWFPSTYSRPDNACRGRHTCRTGRPHQTAGGWRTSRARV
jgi:hypothetical protein